MFPSHASSPDELLAMIDAQQSIFDSLPMILLVFDVLAPTRYRLSGMNAMAARSFGEDRTQLLGKEIGEFMPPASVEWIVAQTEESARTRAMVEGDLLAQTPAGPMWLRGQIVPLFDDGGQLVRTVNIVVDITEQKEREQRDQEEKDRIIASQNAVLVELSSPLLQISESTVVMPLIGAIDSRRVEMIMQELLTGVTTYAAQFVIIDITGLPIVDTQVANALLHATQAVKLLGAKVVLTGIRPEVAQTLVGLGVDLSSIVTLSSLQSGIAFALRQR
ncbi:STAS domain-containing protein [Chloroflexia bacterium SDU3-3]|nr:STAS domain-containing protein [Chloroflexia bacterium SDU3-3]